MKIESGSIVRIVPWDCEGIEQPYGWMSVERVAENKNRLKGKKKIDGGTDALVVERVEMDTHTLMEDNYGLRVYYWCMSKHGRLLVDMKFIESV
jgi:hypothetical protein